jgi:hypothetical protein
MTKSVRALNYLKSRGLVILLLCGNIALALAALAQSQIIQDQKQLIRVLYQDSAELTSFKIAANMAKAQKH